MILLSSNSSTISGDVPADLAGEQKPLRCGTDQCDHHLCGSSRDFHGSGHGGRGRHVPAPRIGGGNLQGGGSDPTVVKALNLESHDMAERVKLLVAVYDAALKLIPACIMILACATSYIGYLILSKSLSRRGEVKRMPRFREFDVPNTAVFVLVGIYMIVWLLSMTGFIENNAFYTNMDLLFDFVMYLQGSFGDFHAFLCKAYSEGVRTGADHYPVVHLRSEKHCSDAGNIRPYFQL